MLKFMLNKIKPYLGPLYPIAAVFVVGLVIFFVSRLGLAIWHFERVSDAGGWLTIFLSGLRVDIVSLCYLLILPALLSSL
ncbi:LTA synthase family protein, partial [Vibrio anguillarum]|nr:LTA synthase family protein [Vibrio anguillarum]